ncbi:MAG: PhoPQ-activated pathogenicity, partial [bacterium]|nr:PhoPQ-activated pathogenicity [bacterium]
DAKWLPRLPMTKAAVRAMDAISDLAKSAKGGGHTVDKYVVAGGSKRGWTTWTTAAVDKRVVAIIPLVIDLLNLEPSMIHHYRAYGFWAPAIGDYERMGIMNWVGRPKFRALLQEVDPFSFRDRFTMPKFCINSSGDQFFLPDSAQFYFDDLPGEKYLHYIPNTDHSLEHNDTFESIFTYFWSVINDKPRPEFSWRLPEDGGIVVTAKDQPSKVMLWKATNSRERDFRLEKIGAAWEGTALTPSNGVYTTKPSKPAKGWTAYFLELTFPSGGRFPYKFTTPIRVTPDTLPHPAPKGEN